MQSRSTEVTKFPRTTPDPPPASFCFVVPRARVIPPTNEHHHHNYRDLKAISSSFVCPPGRPRGRGRGRACRIGERKSLRTKQKHESNRILPQTLDSPLAFFCCVSLCLSYSGGSTYNYQHHHHNEHQDKTLKHGSNEIPPPASSCFLVPKLRRGLYPQIPASTTTTTTGT